ncbi:MAG: hypothetical protein Q4D43_11415 [Clostridia bacterium]|nr:hypothetical protein [Clostridia bacterium]
MKRKIENQDWQNLYADIPDCVHIAADSALNRIHARKRRRTGFAAIAAAAACLAITAAVLLTQPNAAPDQTAVESKPVIVLTAQSIVFASKDDPYFHIDRSCAEHSVELPLITALEFEKTLCPICGERAAISQ